MCRLLCECPKAWTFGCWASAMDATCKSLQSRAGGMNMASVVGAEDDVDFDFLVSYNNSSYMALANAAQDKSVSFLCKCACVCLRVCVYLCTLLYVCIYMFMPSLPPRAPLVCWLSIAPQYRTAVCVVETRSIDKRRCLPHNAGTEWLVSAQECTVWRKRVFVSHNTQILHSPTHANFRNWTPCPMFRMRAAFWLSACSKQLRRLLN